MADENDGVDEPKSERFNMFISKSELDAIEEWAWDHRIRSKSEAVRRLVQIGLRADKMLPEIIKHSTEASEGAIELDDLWKEYHPLIAKEDAKIIDFVKFTSKATWIFKKLISPVLRLQIKILNLDMEMMHFGKETEIEKAISSAEEYREKSERFWNTPEEQAATERNAAKAEKGKPSE